MRNSKHRRTPGSDVTLTPLAAAGGAWRPSRRWLWLGRRLLTANLFSPHKGALKFSGAFRLKYVWTKEVLDDNLGCRPLKSLYTLFQICKCSFGYGSWSSFHEHSHSYAEKRVKSVIYQTQAEIAWFQFPCLPFLYAWNCLYHLCLCTIYIKMFFLSPVTNSVWVNIKTIPLTSKRSKRMQEKSKKKTMNIR